MEYVFFRLALSAVKAIRAKVTNQIADQTTDIREVDIDENTGEIIIDGQVPMRDKKSPKEHIALEVALNDVVEITIHGKSRVISSSSFSLTHTYIFIVFCVRLNSVHPSLTGDAVKMKKTKDRWNSRPLCNSVKKTDDKDNKDKVGN